MTLVLHGRQSDDCALGPIHESPCIRHQDLEVGTLCEPEWGNSLLSDSQ